jgi:hypothetical protein
LSIYKLRPSRYVGSNRKPRLRIKVYVGMIQFYKLGLGRTCICRSRCNWAPNFLFLFYIIHYHSNNLGFINKLYKQNALFLMFIWMNNSRIDKKVSDNLPMRLVFARSLLMNYLSAFFLSLVPIEN